MNERIKGTSRRSTTFGVGILVILAADVKLSAASMEEGASTSLFLALVGETPE
jgi:hypothetical protein